MDNGTETVGSTLVCANEAATVPAVSARLIEDKKR